MAEAEATIPENSNEAPDNEEKGDENVENSTAPTPAAEAAPKRGRPPGSKDKAPRRKVKVEPLAGPAEEPPAPAPKVRPKAPPPVATPSPSAPSQRERTPSPDPPSPRTLYRETSKHLINLRDIMNSQKRASVAERYTSRLHDWPVV